MILDHEIIYTHLRLRVTKWKLLEQNGETKLGNKIIFHFAKKVQQNTFLKCVDITENDGYWDINRE